MASWKAMACRWPSFDSKFPLLMCLLLNEQHTIYRQSLKKMMKMTQHGEYMKACGRQEREKERATGMAWMDRTLKASGVK